MKFTKFIPVILVMASTICYAAVSSETIFDAVRYDKSSEEFIAVGHTPTNNILAASKDGHTWTAYPIVFKDDTDLASKDNRIIQEITTDAAGTIFLADNMGGVYTATIDFTLKTWSFEKVRSMFPENTEVEVMHLYKAPTESNVEYTFALIRVPYSNIKQIVQSKITYAANPKGRLQTSVEKKLLITSEGIQGLGLVDLKESGYRLSYTDKLEKLYWSTNGGPFILSALHANTSAATEDYILETYVDGGHITECVISEGDNHAPQKKCINNVYPSSGLGASPHVNLSLSFAGSITADEDDAIITVLSSASYDKVAVIEGDIVADAFVYKKFSQIFAVAERTCFAHDDGIGNNRRSIILGKDNKALVSTKTRGQWDIVTM